MVVVDHPIRAPDPGLRTQRPGGHARILWALSASIALHLWLAGGIAPGAPRASVPFLALPLEARLEPAGAPAAPAQSARDAVRTERAEPLTNAASSRRDAKHVAAATGLRPVAPPESADYETLARGVQRSAPAPLDPVYYSARELDVYPAPLTPLVFGFPTHLADGRLAGDVLVRLMVDEAGAVDHVAVIGANPPGYLEEYARAKLAFARFSPGRREGRAVKSQVTARVSFDPIAREGALR